MKIIRPKRLKIAEQIIIVLLCAVVIPMAISGFIINNINQQSVRKQLRESAVLITNVISEAVDAFYVPGMNINNLKSRMFNFLQDDKRQIYILDSKDKIVASRNYDADSLNRMLKLLPANLEKDNAEIFGDRKNQPMVYFKKTTPNILILVNTTENITDKTIYQGRIKIILSVLISAAAIVFVVLLYTYYLYINIRQLFKGIIAISKGNYKRNIRLLKNIFTPNEIVFLTFEFNKMASQIHQSYLQLKRKNAELKQLNEFRSNMIDTVSHEFRTPLTSIQGYTSRLLRQDIELDKDMQEKSLKIIKKQAERLTRMVEDLLVIPDIEGNYLRVNIEPVNPAKALNSAILAVEEQSHEIVSKLDDNFPIIYADKDRLEQIFTNLLENAVKYAQEGSQIIAEGFVEGNRAKISVKNQCDQIPSKILKKLFEKFTRIDDKTTRTTRGTGLGLFIVQGLMNKMNGKIKLTSTKEWGFCATLDFPICGEEL